MVNPMLQVIQEMKAYCKYIFFLVRRNKDKIFYRRCTGLS